MVLSGNEYLFVAVHDYRERRRLVEECQYLPCSVHLLYFASASAKIGSSIGSLNKSLCFEGLTLSPITRP